jgi:hypothetical protein
MKAILDPNNALGRGLASIRSQFQIPDTFPPEVLEAAEAAAKRRRRSMWTAPRNRS